MVRKSTPADSRQRIDGSINMKEELKMPNGNGQGPANAGPKSGRGLGFCSGSGMPGRLNSGATQNQVAAPEFDAACSGPRGCGTGVKSGNGRRNGNGCGNKRNSN